MSDKYLRLSPYEIQDAVRAQELETTSYHQFLMKEPAADGGIMLRPWCIYHEMMGWRNVESVVNGNDARATKSVHKSIHGLQNENERLHKLITTRDSILQDKMNRKATVNGKIL
jgi:hypothetical protein